MRVAATALLEPIPRKPIAPKAAARFAARAFRALLRFPTRTVRRPQAVVALATIEPSRTGEKKRRDASYTRPIERYGTLSRTRSLEGYTIDTRGI
jgi:hypothetical protein